LSGQPAAIVTHLTEANRAARANPTSAEAVGAAGLAFHADMFYEQAHQYYEIARELGGDAWRWTYYDALAKGERGDTEGLTQGLRKVVRVQPGLSAAWWQLGEAEFKAGRYDGAREAWHRVLMLNEPTRATPTPGTPARAVSAPISAYAELGLARVAMLEGDAAGAQELLEKVTRQSARFGPAFRLLGSAYAALGLAADAERAVRTADRLPGYDPYVDPMIDALARESRSSTFLLQQASTADLDTNAAWHEYLVRRAVEFDPANADALYELASMLRVLRRYDEALAVLERHRRLVPGDSQALAQMGRCLVGSQRFAEAESVLRRALEGLDDADTHFNLGVALDRQGRLPEAVAEYQRALDRNPNHKEALNYLGVSLVRQGKLDQAAREFERLISTDPDNADAHTNLGAVFLTQKKESLAEREFRTALQLSPDHALAREGLRKVRR
jgi:tetratricopeptide (TPR) repeat protein